MPRPLWKIAAPAAGALVLLALLCACGPSLWHRYLEALSRRSAPLYQPRERVIGGNEPAAPRVAPGTELLDAAALEEAARYAAAHGSRALIVSRHDHIVFERYWQGTDFRTLSDAQGFTPLLAALATGVALSHRRIGWPDEPVGLLIPQWRDDPRGAITVRELLQYSSGLAPDAASDPSTVLARALAAPPGTVRLEQGADPQLLALVLQNAMHARYAEVLSGSLWRRLGAADAFLWLDRPGGTAHADCCMFAAQGDWIRVGQLMLRDGNYRGDEIIRPGWVTLMRAPARSDADFGSYLRLAARPAPGREAYAVRDLFVVGGRGGNRLWLIPSLQLAILCTGEAAGRDAAWDDARIPNLVMRGARDYLPPAALPGAELSSMVPGH